MAMSPAPRICVNATMNTDQEAKLLPEENQMGMEEKERIVWLYFFLSFLCVVDCTAERLDSGLGFIR